MICISVENLTIKGFIEVIDTRQFENFKEFNQFITDFYNHIKTTAITDGKAYSRQLEVIKKAEYKNQFKKEYDNVMEGIDEIILSRAEYLDKLESKYKYRGRYGKPKGSVQGKACNDNITEHREFEAPKQLRFVSPGWE